MATQDLSALERLVGDEPRPVVKVRRFDRHELKNSLKKSRGVEVLPQFAKPFNPKGKTTSDQVKKPTGIRADFGQGPVPDSTQYPYSLIGICFVQNHADNSNSWCTGTLVGSNMILTAGNAIPWNNDWSMQFIPAYNSGTAPFGVVNVSQVWGYNPNGSCTDDYLVAHLETPIGNEIGWFGTYGSGNGGDYQAAPSYLWNSVGYPNGTVQITTTNFGIDNTGTSDGDGSVDLDTQVFIQPGWVGGPVWAQFDFNGTDGDLGPWVCGVVAGGGISIDFWGNVSQWQVNEGGNDMVSIVLYGQDNWL